MAFKNNILIITDETSQYAVVKSPEIKSCCNTYFCGKQENIFSLLKDNNIRIVIMDAEGDESWEFKLLELIKTFDPIIDVIIAGAPVPSEKIMDWISL